MNDSVMDKVADPKQTMLQPHIGWFGAAMIIVGSMIGSGIFLTPANMANKMTEVGGEAPTAGLMLGLWIFAGLFTLCGALCFAELAAMHPHAGGQYVYLREAFGPLVSFLFGWALFLVIQTGFNAAVSIAFAKYLGVFVPGISEEHVLLHLPMGGIVPESAPAFLKDFSINSAQLVACGVIIVLTLINMLGVKEGSLLQNVLTVIKIAGLAGLIVAGLAHAGQSADHFTPFLPSGEAFLSFRYLGGLAVAMAGALFAYDAWNTATFVAEEVRDPSRNLPRALAFGTSLVMAIYVLAVFAYIVAVPIESFTRVDNGRIAQQAATTWFGPIGTTLVVIAILVSTFGCVNGLVLSGARVIYAMAREGLFFRSCARLHPTTKTPVVALVVQGVWSCVLTLTGSYDKLLTYIVFSAILFGALTVAGLFVLRWKQPDRPRPYKCFAYPLTPILYLLVAAPFLVYVVLGDPESTGIGIAIVLTGLPVYLLFRAKRPRQDDEQITRV